MLHIPFLEQVVKLGADYADWKHALRDLTWQAVACHNWSAEFPYAPEVHFQLAHTADSIVVHFTVREDYIRAAHITPNSSVWTDSCVEFFLSLDNKEHYYNVEFNILGTGLIGYGTSAKSSRQRFSNSKILSVNTYTSVSRSERQTSWAIVLVIPKSLFDSTKKDWRGRMAHANFYKCGDELPQPHFLSWRPIDHPTPNFHLPAFFGEVQFG